MTTRVTSANPIREQVTNLVSYCESLPNALCGRCQIFNQSYASLGTATVSTIFAVTALFAEAYVTGFAFIIVGALSLYSERNIQQRNSSAAQNEINSLRAQNAQLQEMQRNVLRERDEARAAHRQVNTTLASTQDQYTNLQTSYDSLRHHHQELREELENFQGAISSLTKNVEEHTDGAIEFANVDLKLNIQLDIPPQSQPSAAPQVCQDLAKSIDLAQALTKSILTAFYSQMTENGNADSKTPKEGDTQLESLKRLIEEKTDELNQINDRIRQTSDALTSASASHSSAMNTLIHEQETLQNAVRKEKELFFKASKELEDTYKTLHTEQRKIEAKTQELADLEKAIRDAKKQVDSTEIVTL